MGFPARDAASRYSATLAAGVAVAALAAAAYANALGNGLVWDDPIVLNRQLLAFQSLHDLIFTPRNIPQYSPDYYRPLTTLSYLLDRGIAGSAPWMFHLSVVIYHVIATVLVFRLGLAVLGAAVTALPAATIGAALFAVHPIHSESVAWGAGRSDVLACVFSLLAVLAFRRPNWTVWRRALGASALVFAAALAKETAASLFVLVPVLDLILEPLAAPVAAPQPRAARRRQPAPAAVARYSRWAHYACFAVTLAVYVTLRQAALGTIVGAGSGSGPAILASILAAVAVYVGKLLLPLAQCAYISDLPSSAWALAASALLCAAIVAAGWLAWRRGERRVTALLLWIGLTLAPSLSIVAKIPAAPIAERYLYLPSVGFCLLAGYGAVTLGARIGRPAMLTAVVALVIAGAVATVRRNAVWRTNLSLWEDTAAKNRTDGLPVRSLGGAYLEAGDHAKAREYFLLALQRRNDVLGQFVIDNNLGSLAMFEHRLDDAEQHYRSALSLNPNASEAQFNLGLIALTRATNGTVTDASVKRTQAQRARALFEQAHRGNPLDADVIVALGQTLSALGDAPGARVQYERALQLGLPESTATAVRQLLSELPN